MWNLIFVNNLNVTNDTNVRNFQYKITHRIIACNYNLKIWKIKTNDICDFCIETDTIEHFLVECEHIYKFWQQIFNWWPDNMKVWLQIDTYEIIVGISNKCNEPIGNQLNFFILYRKYYIYCCKKGGNNMNLYMNSSWNARSK
jgi:hypothetical protein